MCHRLLPLREVFFLFLLLAFESSYHILHHIILHIPFLAFAYPTSHNTLGLFCLSGILVHQMAACVWASAGGVIYPQKESPPEAVAVPAKKPMFQFSYMGNRFLEESR